MWEALQQARQATAKDIWIVGGAVAMQSALEDGLIDLMEIFLVPVMLGKGVSLLNDLRLRQTLIFDGIESFPDGVVKLRYIVSKQDRPRAQT
jgi:dihydrofolate reductase